jgi:hypothetical protein
MPSCISTYVTYAIRLIKEKTITANTRYVVTLYVPQELVTLQVTLQHKYNISGNIIQFNSYLLMCWLNSTYVVTKPAQNNNNNNNNNNNKSKVTILWSRQVQTDRTTPNNKPDRHHNT